MITIVWSLVGVAILIVLAPRVIELTRPSLTYVWPKIVYGARIAYGKRELAGRVLAAMIILVVLFIAAAILFEFVDRVGRKRLDDAERDLQNAANQEFEKIVKEVHEKFWAYNDPRKRSELELAREQSIVDDALSSLTATVGRCSEMSIDSSYCDQARRELDDGMHTAQLIDEERRKREVQEATREVIEACEIWRKRQIAGTLGSRFSVIDPDRC